MINRTILVGRLTKDVELRHTKDNKAVAKFTLAVNDRYKQDHTNFIMCVAWTKQAENMEKYVGKGSLVGIEGRIETGSYDNKEGFKVYTTEVVCDSVQFLEPKKEESYSEHVHRKVSEPSKPLDDVSEDDLPF